MARRLIVNADDFGMSAGVNRGIILAHERGVVTSASLMTRGAVVEEAVDYARRHPSLDLGLHVDLAEWSYEHGEWVLAYSHVDHEDFAAVSAEVSAQLAAFRRLTGRDPSHLDSHQHVHRNEPVHSVLVRLAQELGVPLRWYTPHIVTEGSFYGRGPHGEPLHENITVGALLALVRERPDGVTELMCHPGCDGDTVSGYVIERELELATLCDPDLAAGLDSAGIALITFPDATD